MSLLDPFDWVVLDKHLRLHKSLSKEHMMIGVYKCRKLLTISVSDVDDDGDKKRKVVIRVMIPTHRDHY